MKNLYLLIVFSLFIGCGDEEEKSQDEKTAENIWQEIQGYSEWGQSIDWTGIKASLDGTHGNFVQIWLNGKALPSFEDSSSSELPYGSICVKEGYSSSDGSTINSITVMKKIEGFDSDHGDWFWASYDSNGDINKAGSVSSCYNCHTSGTDYIRFTEH